MKITKCITFDKEAQDSLPKEIKDKMKANQEAAKQKAMQESKNYE